MPIDPRQLMPIVFGALIAFANYIAYHTGILARNRRLAAPSDSAAH